MRERIHHHPRHGDEYGAVSFADPDGLRLEFVHEP